MVFPPNVPVQLTVPFTVSYSPNPELGAIADPALNEIIQLCVQNPILSPTNNRTTTIAYSAVNTIAALSWIGYKPTLSNQLNINCPFQGEAKRAFLTAIQGSGTKGVTGQVNSSFQSNSFQFW